MRRHATLLLATLLAGVLGGACPAVAATGAPALPDRGPLAIHTPAPLPPSQLAGSGLEPEAAVRVTIDERGNVTAVEVGAIAPSTEHDALFRAQLVETLADWRYAPAIRDGRETPASLSWKLRFQSQPAGEESADQGLEPILFGADAEQRRAAVLALPVEQRRALLAAQSAAAAAALDPSAHTQASSGRFSVHTDALGAEVAAAVAGNLEAMYNVLADLLLPGIELQPEPYKVQVFVYRDHVGYGRLQSSLPALEWSAGFYSAAGLVAFHLAQPTSEAVTGVLLHETTHAFTDRHLVRPGVSLPRWLSEGFATYIGNSQVKKGRLVPGKTLRGVLEFNQGQLARYETSGASHLQAVKRALKQGHGLGVDAILSASPDTFYGERSTLFYATSWLLVHFLRDGADDGASRFARLMLYAAEGYPVPRALEQLYGDLDTLDRDFRAYVAGF